MKTDVTVMWRMQVEKCVFRVSLVIGRVSEWSGLREVCLLAVLVFDFDPAYH